MFPVCTPLNSPKPSAVFNVKGRQVAGCSRVVRPIVANDSKRPYTMADLKSDVQKSEKKMNTKAKRAAETPAERFSRTMRLKWGSVADRIKNKRSSHFLTVDDSSETEH
ncbi:hypothetical protein CYMTET_53432 [Cymbomonas tetramitiformis]|uniref:Uncharacterized protein n=1 Tax=Cymbomonas tetramitiformis TaxID=36881 RepID=A0AAE0EQC6_9CHLO|nr:hypothetical protein CYMTET_53432 [Cymbomonas tetramitiformis]